MVPRTHSVEARTIAIALGAALVIVLGGTAAYLWGPLHQTYEVACQLYPPLRTVGPVPLGLATTLLLAGLLAGLITVARELLVSRRLSQRVARVRGMAIPNVGSMSEALGVAGCVTVAADDQPYAFCFGLARPAICLSAGLVESLDENELRAVLAHETVHLRARDPLRLALGRALSRVLFFMPLRGQILRRYLLARELRADREALKTVTRQDLASALLKLLRANQNPNGADGVALFNGIDERIKQLEQSPDLSTPALAWGRGVAQFTLGLGLLLVVFGLAGQMSLALVIGCQV